MPTLPTATSYLEWAAGFVGDSVALYKTSDAGATWELVNPLMQTPEGRSVGAIVPGATPDVLYGARLEINSLASVIFSVPGQPCVSTDGGKTWRFAAPLDGEFFGLRIVPSPTDPRVVYGYKPGSKAVYRSSDQGASWTPFLSMQPRESIVDIAVDRIDPSTVYVRTSVRSVVTSDGGATWKDMAPVPADPNVSNFLVADPLTAGRVYAVYRNGAVSESRDRAATWRAVIPTSGTLLDGLTLSTDGQRRYSWERTRAARRGR